VSHQDTPTPNIQIRPRAITDIEVHAEYLEESATPDVAIRFRTAIMQAIDQVAYMPGSGAPRKLLNPLLAGLRMKLVPGFRNYLLFYITPTGNIEIVRILHGAQDVNRILEDEE
jgi:toxin ParE1/3/4